MEILVFRDNNKPINVLTGIDYWLDNLICNVPELVMCFHVNGIVQVSLTLGFMPTSSVSEIVAIVIALSNLTLLTKITKILLQNKKHLHSHLKTFCSLFLSSMHARFLLAQMLEDQKKK